MTGYLFRLDLAGLGAGSKRLLSNKGESRQKFQFGDTLLLFPKVTVSNALVTTEHLANLFSNIILDVLEVHIVDGINFPDIVSLLRRRESLQYSDRQRQGLDLATYRH